MFSTLVHAHSALQIGIGAAKTDKEVPKKLISKVYDPCLKHFKPKPFKMMEIGVRGGGSTRLWLSFFEQVQLWAIDNGDDLIPGLFNEISQDSRLTFLKEDAYKGEVFSIIPNDFDVVIDDGPHSLFSQVYFVKNYINILNKFGIMFIEDIQAQHWLDNLISAIPRNFKGCSRVVDLRSETGVGDNLVLIIHNCNVRKCEMSIYGRNYNTRLSRLLCIMKLRKIVFHSKGLVSKVFWKLKSLNS